MPPPDKRGLPETGNPNKSQIPRTSRNLAGLTYLHDILPRLWTANGAVRNSANTCFDLAPKKTASESLGCSAPESL
jgi:hypothetical protein